MNIHNRHPNLLEIAKTGDISMVLKMAHFRKSTGPQWVKTGRTALLLYVEWFNDPVESFVSLSLKQVCLIHQENYIFVVIMRWL